jgi:predicted enzyme related to lactoylglutathione lyase
MAPTPTNGKICYLEIPATDVERSSEFYRDVFGWNIRRRGDGHLAFDDSTGQVSGAWVIGRPPQKSGILIYVMVDNIEATVKSVASHGGTIVQLLRFE